MQFSLVRVSFVIGHVGQKQSVQMYTLQYGNTSENSKEVPGISKTEVLLSEPNCTFANQTVIFSTGTQVSSELPNDNGL